MNFSPEVSFFSLNISCFGRYSGKKLVKMGSENGKMLENRKRKWIFNRKSAIFFKIFKASRALWQKVAKFCHRKRKWGPEMLKIHVFWKNRALCGKKFEIYKTFSPPNRKYKAFIAFLSDNIFNFEAKEAKFFFF